MSLLWTTHNLRFLSIFRPQVNKEKYKSLGNGFKLTFQEGGAKNLFLGWAPTAIGYSMQGVCKFGFYEVFKNFYSGLLGEENSYLYRTSLYLVSPFDIAVIKES